ncbi:MAG: hypothetical protein VX227_00535, partial [Nitrospinota bacterium]|nr:hypothetical protein [Nitrospinota bacterium]
ISFCPLLIHRPNISLSSSVPGSIGMITLYLLKKTSYVPLIKENYLKPHSKNNNIFQQFKTAIS